MFPAVILMVVVGQAPLSTRVELPSGKVVNLSADFVEAVGGGEQIFARGNVELTTDELVVRSNELTYDAEEESILATGNVQFFAFPYVGVAEQVRVDVNGRDATLTDGLLMKKKGVPLEALTKAQSLEQLKQMGESDLMMKGSRIRQLSEDTFEVQDLSFTPCDCNARAMSWRVTAKSANVRVGDRATLTLPVVYVKNVPVFALPWLYLPLSERRTGLLFPRPLSTRINGFSFEQPVFFALGRSYDATLTPGYVFGNGDTTTYGVRGPRMTGEFRYAPSGQALGRVSLGVIDDLRLQRVPNPNDIDPQTDQIALADFGNPGEVVVHRRRGIRGDASVSHLQELGHGFFDRVDASMVSDGYYVRDLTADVLAREAQYLRSTATVYHRGEDTWAGLDTVLRQDLRFGYSLIHQDRDEFGNVVHGPNTFQRLPGLTFALPQKELWGPLQGSFTGSVVRIAPFSGNTGDEGCDGVFGLPPSSYQDVDGSQGNRKLDSCPVGTPGERQPRTRLDLSPRLSASFGLGRFATVSPYLGLRQDAYFSEGNQGVAQRGYILMGTQVSTELSRTFSFAGAQFRHAITPVTEVRFLPHVWGGVPGASLDEVDSARRPQRLLQAVTEVRQTLAMRQGSSLTQQVLRLDLGQDYQLDQLAAADAFARLGFSYGFVRAAALSRYDWHLKAISQTSATASVDNGHGSAVYAGYDHLLLSGSDRMRAGIDELFVLNGASKAFADQITAGVRVALPFGLSGRYEVLLTPAYPDHWRQMTVGASYGPACDCWRLDVGAAFRPPPLPSPDVSAAFTISHFGSFGTGG